MKSPSLTSRLALPLLAKELIEQAARKRTYVIRVLYASLLFVAGCLMFYETLRVGAASPTAVLGRGRNLFDALMGLQFAGIYLFMPAITCGVITQEKERQSLMLLFLTKLGPWAILFEKLLSRVIPMCCFLLLSLPLLAYAYTLGGISTEYLVSGVWYLLLTVLQVGALSLACSSWFRTTVQAFVGTYLIGALMIFGPPLTMASLAMLLGQRWNLRSSSTLQILQSTGLIVDPDQLLIPFFAPAQFFSMRAGPAWGATALSLLGGSLPLLLSTGLFLLLARAFVVRRAFAPARNLLGRLFRWLDGAFHRMNNNPVTRGTVLIGDKGSLPTWRPVAWRETTKRSLGKANHLFRIFLAIEIPLAFLLVLIVLMGNGDMDAASALLFILWVLAVLIVSVHSASLIAGERSRQTLDVLCTTPLNGRTILLEKFRGVERVMLVLLVPFFSIFLLEVYCKHSLSAGAFNYRRPFDSVLYLICSSLSVLIYLPLAAWFSFLIGLKVKTQARAIIAALAGLVGWCVLPLVFIVLPLVIMLQPRGPNSGLAYLLLLSPAAIVPFNEFSEWHKFGDLPWLAVTLNFLIYGVAMFALRHFCLRYADRWLGRAEGLEWLADGTPAAATLGRLAREESISSRELESFRQ